MTVTDRRLLAFTDIGGRDWPCVLFFHGAPSSRLRLAYLENEFLRAKVRVISLDRPGYGGSSTQPNRSMADWPRDVNAIADALGIDRFVVAGHSSGGPYALACAALIPERVSSSIILGGVTDFAWPGAWEGYLDLERRMMTLPDLPSVVDACEKAFGSDGSGFMTAAALSFPEPDAQLYENEAIARLLSASRVESFRQGVIGYAQDIFVQGRPWPFRAGAIGSPVHVLHGESDALLPLAHAEHTAELIRGSTLEVVRGHGHFSILGTLPLLVRTLAT